MTSITVSEINMEDFETFQEQHSDNNSGYQNKVNMRKLSIYSARILFSVFFHHSCKSFYHIFIELLLKFKLISYFP